LLAKKCGFLRSFARELGRLAVAGADDEAGRVQVLAGPVGQTVVDPVFVVLLAQDRHRVALAADLRGTHAMQLRRVDDRVVAASEVARVAPQRVRVRRRVQSTGTVARFAGDAELGDLRVVVVGAEARPRVRRVAHVAALAPSPGFRRIAILGRQHEHGGDRQPDAFFDLVADRHRRGARGPRRSNTRAPGCGASP
jgi:hypothetical protein